MATRHLTRAEISEACEYAWFCKEHPTITLSPESSVADIAAAVGRDKYELFREMLIWAEVGQWIR